MRSSAIVSLIIWALLIVVTAKYVLFLMQADNKGEGGILSLMALAQIAFGKKRCSSFCWAWRVRRCFPATRSSRPPSRCFRRWRASSRSMPNSRPFVLPATVAILILLFLAQSRGTAGVAAFFGPIMVVFFAVNAVLGVTHIPAAWSILRALSPLPGLAFLYASMARSASSCSAASSSPSPAPRRSTPTWGISAAGRSNPPGCFWSCPR